jgi:hypothetical protein
MILKIEMPSDKGDEMIRRLEEEQVAIIKAIFEGNPEIFTRNEKGKLGLTPECKAEMSGFGLPSEGVKH